MKNGNRLMKRLNTTEHLDFHSYSREMKRLDKNT